MTTATATLTPTANQTPAVVNISNELSGSQWVARFPGTTSTNDLSAAFRPGAVNFIDAMSQAGATITISSTLRPPERAYMMHWSWKIVQGTSPNSVPAMNGVNIEWEHPTSNASTQAAKNMVNGFGIQKLLVAPSLTSRHTQGDAIDMSISWSGVLSILKTNGQMAVISSLPRSEMNTELHAVGAGYGVIKFLGGTADRPHWSTDGR